MKRKLLKDLISPYEGIFDFIPDEIWGDLYEAADLNLDFFFKYGERYANALSKHAIESDDPEAMKNYSMLLYRKHKRQLEQMFEALHKEYEMFLTGHLQEERTYTRLENLTGNDSTQTSLTGLKTMRSDVSNILNKMGAISHIVKDDGEHSSSDTRTHDASRSNQGSGRDKTIDIMNKSGDITDSGSDVRNTSGSSSGHNESSLNKTVSEVRTGHDNRSVNMENARSKDSSVDSTKDNTGTQKNDGSAGVYAFDSESSVPRNTTKADRTDNLKETFGSTTEESGVDTQTGTDNLEKSETLTSSGRDDTSGSETSETSNLDSVEYGKISETTEESTNQGVSGYCKNESSSENVSDATEASGTHSNTIEDTTDYSGYSEDTKIDTSGEEEDVSSRSTDGTHDQNREVTYKENLDRKSDSPLQTTQRLILEELEVRRINFTDEMFELFANSMTLKVWR